MAKKTNDRSKSGNTSNSYGSDGVDLLELGPEDGQELLEFEGSSHQEAIIKVIGVGGGGGNALNTMIQSGLGGVDFIAANTDAQALSHNLAPTKVQLGAEITRGLGCGANPDRGRASALEARDRLRELLEGSDMVFVTAGMGGGTGTGAAPIVAEVAREVGALTVGVVTKPFPFEGRVRMKHAGHGLDELHGVVDTLITIPNQRLLALAGKGTAMKDAFSIADQVLLNAVRGISDLITVHGLINLDFADVRTVMNEAGVALMGTGTGRGDTRAIDAAAAAISSPLLEDLSIEGARGVLINITGGVPDPQAEIERERAMVDAPNVTPIRDPEPIPAHASAEMAEQPPAQQQQVAASGGQSADNMAQAGLGFESPFEDELDTPAFLRKRTTGSDDRDVPPFMRRGGSE